MMVDTNITPLASSDNGWQRCAVTLGTKTDVEAEIAELASEGWELECVAAPHYGRLLLIGYFRRRCDLPGTDVAEGHAVRARVTATPTA